MFIFFLGLFLLKSSLLYSNLSLFLREEFIKSYARYRRAAPPEMPMIFITTILFKYLRRPPKNNNRIISSINACPIIVKTADRNPLLAEFVIIIVNMGPGTIAPENPTNNALKNIKLISIKLFYQIICFLLQYKKLFQ